jgi:Permuted papain-like amidase enzyme, YaeF/YiiX, C92 family
MSRSSLKRALRRRVIRWSTTLLTKPLGSYTQRVPNNIEKLKKTLRKGDVLLVEGDQRVSQVIRYLTQSSWSHSCLYIGDELVKGDAQRAAELSERFAADARHMLIEAVVGEGVIASPISKYEPYNIRICRPNGLRREDVDKMLAYAIARLGNGYDVRHIFDLARYFFPVSIVPQRWRRAALHFGRGSEREVICSSMIATAFHLVGYPITPQVTIEANGAPHPWWHRLVGRNGHRPVARFRKQDPALITPRDFDLSPYFEVVKFNHLGDPRFSYRDIVWESDGEPDLVADSVASISTTKH